jgi:hypothetical protein
MSVLLAAFLLFILGCGFLGSTHMIAIYVSPIMVPQPFSSPSRAAAVIFKCHDYF